MHLRNQHRRENQTSKPKR